MKNSIYLLGIGGIGMSALARYFLSQHKAVHGYDHVASPVTDRLIRQGAIIHFNEDCAQIPENVDMVIITPAIGDDNLEYQYFVRHHIPVYKRSQILGSITGPLPTLAVAGTHGKTTVTAMIAHFLHPEIGTLGFIGGIAKNFEDNFVNSPHPQIAVAEADEFDRSFLALHPSTAVITAMDADHLDIYGERRHLIEAFQQFAGQTRHTIIMEEHIAGQIEHPGKKTYGLTESADYCVFNIVTHPNCTTFDLRTPAGLFTALQLHAHGVYNVLNATAAIAAISEEARYNGVLDARLTESLIRNKLKTFAGIRRRFDYIINRPDFVYIDDYAHHPEEMRSFFTAVRQLYPHKVITAIFQPHLYTRTRDFAAQFAEVLTLPDQIILLPIYPAREPPLPGISSEYLLSLIQGKFKVLLQKTELIPYLVKHKTDVLLTIGAGDIDRLVPLIRNTFSTS